MKQTSPSEEQLPIDIDYAKFLDWLIDRQRIPRNWHTLLKTARTLTRTALAQTPRPILADLSIPHLSPHDDLPYHTVRTVTEALTDTSAPEQWGSREKDMLGRYRSPLLRAWVDTRAAFQKKHVHLADAAQQLVRNADIEAPAIKADVARLHTEIADSVRKEGTAIRAAHDARLRFEDACRQFALVDGHGDAIPDFLTQLRVEVARRVPVVLADAVRAVKNDGFTQALDYYEAFAEFVADRQIDGLCTTVKQVRDGDIDDVIRQVVKKDIQSDANKEDIERGVGDDQAAILEVDMLATLNEDTDAAGAEIDWGIEIDASGTGTAADAGTGDTGHGGDINWDVDVDETTGDSEEPNTTPESGRITLADATTREKHLTDLLEVQAFLDQRVRELSRSGGSEIGLIQQQWTAGADHMRHIDAEQVKKMQSSVKTAITSINSTATRRILALQASEKTLSRAARSVVDRKLIALRLEAAVVALRERRTRAKEALALETPRWERLAEITGAVKRDAEKALSDMFRGRTVHILGDINNVFPPRIHS